MTHKKYERFIYEIFKYTTFLLRKCIDEKIGKIIQPKYIQKKSKRTTRSSERKIFDREKLKRKKQK
jgi:hypothetical protein